MAKAETSNTATSKNSKNKSSQTTKISSKKVIGASVLVGLVGLVGFGIGQTVQVGNDVIDSTSFSPIYSVSQAEFNSARNLLGRLDTVDARKNIPDYDSKAMPTWSDIDNDGCPTRYDVLTRDLLDGKTDNKSCTVKSGSVFDYYSGSLIEYNNAISGGGIDIDHIVAKEDAWNSGGYAWSTEQWRAYVNDEDLLISTSASANRQKGGKNAAEWLPQNEEFHCRYGIIQIQIKYKYQLSVTTEEKAALRNILNTECVVND